MKELVVLLQDLGCKNVSTYIQSGNAVFESEEKDPSALAGRISAEIKQRRGFEPTIVLLTHRGTRTGDCPEPVPRGDQQPADFAPGLSQRCAIQTGS